jgi:hypothetical protein
MRKSLSSHTSCAALVACSVLACGLLVILSSAALADSCPNAAFRTGASLHLPDCRAYEMVTPVYKNGAAVEVEAASSDGSSLEALADGGFAGIQGDAGTLAAYYTMTRTGSGWVTSPISMSATNFLVDPLDGFTAHMGMTADLSAGLWLGREVAQSENTLGIFLRRADGSVAEVGPGVSPSAPSSAVPQTIGDLAQLQVAGFSADASHVVFGISDSGHAQGIFWPFDGTIQGSVSLYEYIGTGNAQPMLVGVDNSGKQISDCGTVLGAGRPSGALGDGTEDGHNAVSADGRMVFFTAHPGCAVAPPVAELFARIDNGLPDAHTVAISEPTQADCEACDTEAEVLAGARFEGASADGSKVFFATAQPLLGGVGGLYEYDFDAESGHRVVSIGPLEGHVVQISEDGSHVYFISGSVLTQTQNAEGETARISADNLYAFERDAQSPGGRMSYIATLSSVDSRLWTINNSGSGANGADTTPDGRFLVFTSGNDLTPDDFSTVQQVFEYDAQSEKLVRVSIGQDGFDDNGNTSVNPAEIVSPVERDARPTRYSSKLSVSGDGSYVFFESSAGLTPEAISDPTNAVRNVYEYHAGNVYLISDGRDISKNTNGNSVVRLLGTDVSGQDVFFTATDQLVGQDSDTNVDVYDARIGGGFQSSSAVAECEGDACQGQLGSTPILLSPGSEFQAGGNPPLAAAPQAAKPKAKRKAKSKSRKRRKKGHKANHVGRRTATRRTVARRRGRS